MSTSIAVHRLDYSPPAYQVDRIDLSFSIAAKTTVIATMQFRRAAGASSKQPLALDGRGIELLELSLDGRVLGAQEFQREAESLRITEVPEQFQLQVTTLLDPETNTSLEGLYRSGPMICSQCEARGFSRITYYPDRPDVLAKFRVRIEADSARFPVLLSNGNRIEQGALEGGRHYAVWQDPFPKPCYLFAVVAGDLALVEDDFATASGRPVKLQFYVDHGNQARVPHALNSLKNAMRWDERVYGLEYDLDVYMVVAARDFNMGAMENKGLNLFNARYVLASPQTATDADYEAVEAVIAHEYFHNWTGNRVTCRDWFQLSLKEGLTVFRDQNFSADMNSPAVQRIGEVRMLRAHQFVEDAGPMAHPVRPDSYVEINNFYTVTVYEKGAELIRMIETLVGADTFVRGVQHYLQQHDGSAATIEDFIAAQELASAQNLDGFRRWYAQAGTPVVTVTDEYDAANRRYTLRFRQQTAATPGQPSKLPVPIPIRIALFDEDGARLLIPQSASMPREDLFLLQAEQQQLVLENIEQPPTPSFLRGFSAPVKLIHEYSGEQLARLLLHEDDGYARWEASQRLIYLAFTELTQGARGKQTQMLLGALQQLTAQPPEDKALLAELLRMPSESYLAAQLDPLDPLALTRARDSLRLEIAYALAGPLSIWAGWMPEELNAANAARRALSNVALWYLAATTSARVLKLCEERAGSQNMTLAYGALQALNDIESSQREAAMAAFHRRWREDPLVLDKWFALEAASARQAGLERVQALMQHPDYQPNPNRIRAVLSTLSRENLRAFHRPDGTGYEWLAQRVCELDASNPQIASRMIDGLLGWRGLVEPQAAAMRAALQRLAARPLSADVREKVEKALL